MVELNALLKYLVVIFIFLGPVPYAFAEKTCPVDGEVYPDSAEFCGIHGKRLVFKSKPKVYVYTTDGKTEEMEFIGFNTDCDGYGREGIKYTEQGVMITIPWKNVLYILPEYSRAYLKNGNTIENDIFKKERCNDAQIQETRKKKVVIEGYEREIEVIVKLGIAEMSVIAFDNNNLIDGKRILDGIKMEEENRQRAKEEEDKNRIAKSAGEMVFVKGGCFQMGDTFGDGDGDERPVHKVCVDDFYIGKYEVTQKLWREIMENNPSRFSSCGDDCPVEQVSWKDIQEFIKKLNQRMDSTGSPQQKYRLPTEAEWEYACRSGGKKEKYSGGDDINSVAWYESNSGGTTHPVGQKRPNGLGIYDMSGNVWEWVNDWYDSSYYGNSPKNNPAGVNSGQSRRVLRGGSWFHAQQLIRASNRDRIYQSIRFSFNGFRLVLAAQ